jgi:hypothetical protein
MKKITIIIAMVISIAGYAQIANTDTLLVYTKYTNEGVMIKIAPQLAQTWLLGAENGYEITRAESGTDNEPVLITRKPLKPFTAAEYEEMENGDSVKAYQQLAIFDNMAKNKSKMSMYDRVLFSTKLQNDYGFYYMLVTRIREIGKTSGLEFIDKTAEKDRSYIYSVKIKGDKVESRQGYSFINTVEEQMVLPELVCIEGDKSVEFNWEHKGGTDPVLCYYIEKSEDGKTFHRISSAPVYYQPENKYRPEEEVNNPKIISRNDSLKENYKPYYYRLVGVDIWAEEHTSEDVVKVVGVDKTPPPAVTTISSRDSIEEKSLIFSWEYNAPSDFAGFKLLVSNKLSSGYHLADSNLFPASTGEYTLKNFDKNQPVYFRILTLDTAGNYSVSEPEFAMLPDLFPPSVPTGFTAAVDTNGVLTLRWNANPENDIKGYHVLGCNSARGRYISATGLSVKDTFYIDTLNTNSLTKYKYFRLEALDYNFNTSEQTEPVTVSLPDRIAPLSPVILKVKSGKNGVRINWIPSGSEDVKQQQILRRKAGDDQWKIIGNTAPADTVFVDNLTETGTYDYAMRAIDSAGNKGVFSPEFTVEVKPQKPQILITGFKAKKKNGAAVLTWSSEGATPKFYLVYREDNNKNIRIIASVRNSGYTDNQVSKGNSYRYYIVAQDDKGKLYTPSKIERVGL